ncbi:uncharacterized protein LOC134816547 isoform X2 [Bolinopsis microptera]|uniref:uncharacterized protein LOC134816547 isoform X2 n=1 Tax=Bolinopsis microptera TaxID=2820187 RepID=UPI003078EED1
MNASMESDLKLYLDCILRPTSKESQRQSLCALADLLSTNGDLKAAFREDKGLLSLTKLLLTEEEVSFQQTTMYTLSCAVDSCVSSQNVLIHKGIISLLSSHLKKGPLSPLFQSSVCLLSFLSQGNSLGQNQSRQKGIIKHLVSCLRNSSPVTQENVPVWNSCLTCLSSLVNNPRNSLNQEACMEVIPFCLYILLKNSHAKDLVISISNFLRLCLSDNGSNQEKFFKIGGLKICLDMLKGCQDNRTAWCVISLINSAPKGILLSPDIQVSCVPLLLHWISKGTNEQIPNGLQALSTAIDNNKEARAALVADRNGMSSIIRCMENCDENTRKTAKLLLQSMFTTSTGEKSEGSDSDLESASHEITKQYGNKSEGSNVKSNKVGVQRKQQIKDLKKRTVVVKSSGSWAVPTYERGTERKRCYKRSIRETPRRSEPGSMSGRAKSYSPITPQPTPAPGVEREFGPVSPHGKRQLTTHNREQQLTTQPTIIASIVSRTVEDKMSEFLQRFEQVISTTAAGSIASCSASIVPITPTDNPHVNKTCHQTSGVDKSTDRIVNESVHELSTQKRSDSALTTLKLESGRRFSRDVDEMSVITDISQVTLFNDFFDLNPLLVPSCRNSRFIEIDDSISQYDNSTSNDNVTSHDNVTSRNFKMARRSDGDSGFGHSSKISIPGNSSMPISSDGPKENLSQRFMKMHSDKSNCRLGENLDGYADDQDQHSAVPFTEQEVANLCLGVQLYGRSWSLIIARFQFHSSRTPAQLRRKYSRIKKFLDERKASKSSRSSPDSQTIKKMRV